MTLAREHGHSVVEDITSTLHTLIQPTGSMSFFVDWNRKGLATTVIHGVNKCDIELVRVLSEMVSTTHA
jgi:hypothetical protein